MGIFNISCAHSQSSAKHTETNTAGDGKNPAQWTREPEREGWLEESTIEQEGNEEAERKRWSQQCHAGRKALPWHFANRRERWWWGGYTAEERRGEKGPEGYRCWIALALLDKERKQEIWGKVNLSLTPWPATMCYPLQEASQTERGRRPGRGQKTV